MQSGRPLCVIATLFLLACTASGQSAQIQERIPAEIMNAELRPLDESTSVRLSAYGNKVVILTLWASWVAPCRLSMPELNKLRSRYSNREVEVLGLSSHENERGPTNALRFLAELGIGFPSVWVEESIYEKLDPEHVLPITVVEVNGTIIQRFRGWNSKVTPGLLRKAVKQALKGTKEKPAEKS